jgi:hypothetical protein
MRGVEDPIFYDQRCYGTLLEPGDRQCGHEVIKGIQKALVPTHHCPPHRQISISFTLGFAIPLPYDLESAVTHVKPDDLRLGVSRSNLQWRQRKKRYRRRTPTTCQIFTMRNLQEISWQRRRSIQWHLQRHWQRVPSLLCGQGACGNCT